jgi:hypothetical protein
MITVNMKKITVLSSFVLFLVLAMSLKISGQEARSVTVKAGESIMDVLPFNEIYLYPQFTKGIAVKADGAVTEGLFNYNIIIGEMQFIGSRKDTLAVAHPEYVKYFVINADTFYFDKVYFRRIARNNGFMLAAHQFASLTDVRTAGPYGTTSSTSTVDSYSSLYSQDNAKVYKLKVNVETIYSIRCDYFFTGPDKEFVLARKNFLLKMFPGKSDKIKQFIKENSVRFNNREDLVKLTDFVGSLPE